MSAPEPVDKDLMAERELLLRNSIPVYRFQPLPIPGDDRLTKLKQDRLWMSDPGKFNDLSDLKLEIKDRTCRGPFKETRSQKAALQCLLSGNPQFSNDLLYDDRLVRVLQKWAANPCLERAGKADLISAFCYRFQQFGVACFTSDWQNRLMWAHYASSHQGFCIEYSVKKMQMALDSVNPVKHYRVQYTSELPELCLSELLFSPHQAVGRYLATKHVDWAYEREWRLVSFEHKGECAPMPDGMQISALIAGRKMPEDAQALLRETASRLQVPAFKIVDKHGDEKLEPLEEAGSA